MIVVLRLGPGRLLVDASVGAGGWCIGSIWIDELQRQWRRAPWPLDRAHGLPVAPLDLGPGQVLEVIRTSGPSFFCVLGLDESAVVLTPAETPEEAVALGTLIHQGWANVRVSDAWTAVHGPTCRGQPMAG